MWARSFFIKQNRPLRLNLHIATWEVSMAWILMSVCYMFPRTEFLGWLMWLLEGISRWSEPGDEMDVFDKKVPHSIHWWIFMFPIPQLFIFRQTIWVIHPIISHYTISPWYTASLSPWNLLKWQHLQSPSRVSRQTYGTPHPSLIGCTCRVSRQPQTAVARGVVDCKSWKRWDFTLKSCEITNDWGNNRPLNSH